MRVLRIIRAEDGVVPSSHEPLQLPELPIYVVLKDFKHVFFCIRGGTSRTHAVLWDIELFVVMEELEDHVGRWNVDDGRRDDLKPGVGQFCEGEEEVMEDGRESLHSFMVQGLVWVMHPTSTTTMNVSTKEGHP